MNNFDILHLIVLFTFGFLSIISRKYTQKLFTYKIFKMIYLLSLSVMIYFKNLTLSLFMAILFLTMTTSI